MKSKSEKIGLVIATAILAISVFSWVSVTTFFGKEGIA
jgi:hypothetical protein